MLDSIFVKAIQEKAAEPELRRFRDLAILAEKISEIVSLHICHPTQMVHKRTTGCLFSSTSMDATPLPFGWRSTRRHLWCIQRQRTDHCHTRIFRASQEPSI